MSSAFSSNDTECLSRSIEHEYIVENLNQIWNETRLNECVQWIKTNNFAKVCLQFPDDLIPFSIHILTDLKQNTNTELCILGDTSYGSCCVDEVAASHFAADAVIHFGHACLSKVARLPVLYIFPHFKLNLVDFEKELANIFTDKNVNLVVFYAVGFLYELDKIKDIFKSFTNVEFGELALNDVPHSLCWRTLKKDLTDCVCFYVGSENQTFFNLTITMKAKEWMCYEPQENRIKIISSPLTTNWMRRRNFFVEKCKDAQSLGIVVGTLTTTGYLDVVNHIQNLARNRGIRTYLLSVGKVNPAKLGNFMEIDCFVFVGCPENNIYTSRDFYKPLLSVFEVELALNPAWHEQYPDFYCVDFKEILPNGRHHRDAANVKVDNNYDISLVTGKVRALRTTNDTNEPTNTNGERQIEKKYNQLMETNSSSTFQNRTWTGLDPSLGQQEPSHITKGRSGIPIKYTENENVE